MRQALHILKKDVRYLRWELGFSVALMAMFVYSQSLHSVLRFTGTTILPYLLLLFWAFLCARLIQAEAIPGDRQFWITRPYQWRSLLGAKLLFVAIFIGIPLLAADAIILRIYQFPVAAHLAGLVWALMSITAGVLIVFCAFAALTRGLTEWMLSAIVTVGVLYTLGAAATERVWSGAEWIREYGCIAILLMAALVVLLGQYRLRRTMLCAVVLGAGLLGSSVFVNYAHPAMAFELETSFSRPKADPAAIRLTAMPVAPVNPRPLGGGEVFMLAIPVDVSGLGPGQDLISDEVIVSIKNASGVTWTREGSVADNHLEHVLNGYRVTLRVNRWELAARQAVDLNLRLYLTTVGNPVSTVVRPGGAPTMMRGVGVCQDRLAGNRDTFIFCVSALQAPSNLLAVASGEERRDRMFIDTSYSPFPADADSSIHPVGRYSLSVWQGVLFDKTLTSLEPLAHFRRDLHLPGVHLAAYRIF